MDHNDVTTWKVLIVDDDDSNRTVIGHILRFFDAEVVEASSGPEALNVLSTHTSFTLGLFDIQMPGMSGWQLLEELRRHSHPTLSQIPVIAVTALAMQGDKERILKAGFDGYIVKPVDVGTFITQIVEALNASRETRKVQL